jgi:hypothetical protein
MAVWGKEIRVTRQGDPPFLIDASITVEGQPSTRCWQQVNGPTVHVEAGGDEACNTSCLRQLGLPPEFTPLID